MKFKQNSYQSDIFFYSKRFNDKLLIRLFKKTSLNGIQSSKQPRPCYITNVFKPACTYKTHSLRSKTSKCEKLHVSVAHHKSLRFNGPKIWDSFSDKARKAKATTINEYIHEYKKGNKKT